MYAIYFRLTFSCTVVSPLKAAVAVVVLPFTGRYMCVSVAAYKGEKRSELIAAPRQLFTREHTRSKVNCSFW